MAGGGIAVLLLAAGGAVGTVLDKRSGKFETLLASNVEPEEIVRARLGGLLQRSVYLLLAPVVHGTVTLLVLDGSLENVLHIPLGLVGLALALFTAMLWSLNLSIRFRGMATAVAFSVVWGVPPALFIFGATASGWFAAVIVVPICTAFLLGLYAATVRGFRRSALRR